MTACSDYQPSRGPEINHSTQLAYSTQVSHAMTARWSAPRSAQCASCTPVFAFIRVVRSARSDCEQKLRDPNYCMNEAYRLSGISHSFQAIRRPFSGSAGVVYAFSASCTGSATRGAWKPQVRAAMMRPWGLLGVSIVRQEKP